MRPFDLVVLPLVWSLALYGLGVRGAPRRNRVLSTMWTCWAVSMTLGVPTVRRLVDTVLGIASGTNLLVHLMGLAGTAAMVEFVREMTGRAQGRVSRVNLAGLVAVSVALTVTFAVMPRPDGEVDLVTFSQASSSGYLYWVLLTGDIAIGLASAARLCWIHGRHVAPGPARTSLWLMRVSTLLGTVYLLHRLVYLTLHRAGVEVPQSAAIAGTTQVLLALTLVLFALAVVWPALAEYRQKRAAARQAERIAPLWRLLRAATPRVVLPLPEELRRNNPRLRLYRYVIEIRDSALVLEGHLSDAHLAVAERELRAAGVCGDELAPAVEAALLSHAAAAELAGRAAAFGGRTPARGELDLTAELGWFEGVAAAVGSPAVVSAAERLNVVPGTSMADTRADG
ncbi:MAB_1171c family putative transporter [Kitasatospora sp. NPDC004240]